MKHKIFITALLLLAILINTYAQEEYYFTHYQVENGLSHNTVMCSLQDEQGFIWLGTKDGLNRFDGTSFKVFRNDAENKASIGNGYIRCLSKNASGELFIGTQRGLYKYNARNESFKHIEPSGTKSIKEIKTDSYGNLWFIAEGTLIKYNEKQNKILRYPSEKYFPATSICETEDKNIWVSTEHGLLKKYDRIRDTFTTYDIFQNLNVVTTKWIEKIYATGRGRILIGSSTYGLLDFNLTTLTAKSIINQNADKTGIYVRDILENKKDEYWMATETGLFLYNATNNAVVNLKKNYLNPYSLSDNAVYTLCKDKEGGLWAGTFFGGANYYAHQYALFQKYFPDHGKNTISGNAVREIISDKYGSLWVGTEDAGLNKIDANGIITHFMPTGNKSSIAYYNIHGLLATGDVLWVGTHEHGLDVLDIKTGKRLRHYEARGKPGDLRSNFILSIYKTKAGKILIGTPAGVFLYQPEEDNFMAIPQLSGYTYNVLEDKKGVYWSATISEGIKFYNEKTGKSGSYQHDEKNKNSISNNMVNSLFEDSNENLWIATEGGGACVLNSNRQKFKFYTTKNGLPSNFVFKILEDDKRNLWISTSKGLAELNPINDTIITYTRANGLLNDQFNYNSGYKDASGRLYFGSVKGMISFNPNSFTKNNYIPPIYFTGFQVNNKEVPIHKESLLTQSMVYTHSIALPYSESSFSIDFSALSFVAPQMNAYAYYMEGIDRDWTYLPANRRVYFTNLTPGKYTFNVKVANSSGIWNQQQARLSIIIMPPFWASPGAYFLYALCAISLFVYLIRHYHHRVQKKNKQKMDLLQLDKEKEIYEAKMKFFTNIAHEIRTPLSLIKGPLERVIKKAGHLPEIKNSLEIMEHSTHQLIDLANQLLDYRQTETGSFRLSFKEENITRILKETFDSFRPLAEEKKLLYKIHRPHAPLMAYADGEALIKIWNNLLSNAIKYGESMVYVNLYVHSIDGSFIIEVKNDGYLIPADMKEKIFEPFVRLKKTERQTGTGIGLALARSLTVLHQGEIYVKENTENRNIFVLKLPIHQERTMNNERQEQEDPIIINT